VVKSFITLGTGFVLLVKIVDILVFTTARQKYFSMGIFFQLPIIPRKKSTLIDKALGKTR